MDPRSHTTFALSVPGDKSISHRALIVSALSDGASEIDGLLLAEDPQSTLTCLQRLGCHIERRKQGFRVQGCALRGFSQPSLLLDAGNSGTTLRLLSGLLVGQKFPTGITGDESLRRRPMMRIMEPLRQMGGVISGTPEGTAPLNFEPSLKLRSISYESPTPSAQVKSAILLAGLYAEGTTRVVEKIRTRDHTERMLGLITKEIDGSFVTSIDGGMKLHGQRYVIPGDVSSAAFMIAAALITPGYEVVLPNVGINPSRTTFIGILQGVGATINVDSQGEYAGEPTGTITAKWSTLGGAIRLGRGHVAEMVDEIPMLAAVSAISGIAFEVRGARELRVKESDRIGMLVSNLRTMGGEVEEYDDGFAFESMRTLRPATIRTNGDHRIAMAFGVIGIKIKGLEIDNPGCVEISFPEFWRHLAKFKQGSEA